ncbi:hypothetical protein GCM10023197_45410 [Gordonia humi]
MSTSTSFPVKSVSKAEEETYKIRRKYPVTSNGPDNGGLE